MNTSNLTPVSFCNGAALVLSLFLLGGCACSGGSGTGSDAAGCPKGVRYDESYSYTSQKPGVKSTVGKYDNATDCYVVRKQKGAPPWSNVVTSGPQRSSTGSGDMPLVLEVSDVLFDFDKAVIKQPYVPELERWADYFINNPQVTGEIYGHTDSIGTHKYNQGLSEKRAQAVVKYLVGAGVSADRLRAIGFGEGMPTASNDSEAGRQKNRRVQLDL